MKLNRRKKSHRLILIVWGLVWLNFVAQYLFLASVLVAFLAPTVFIAAVYPLTTYLSDTLLERAIASKKWGIFSIQFVGISVAFGIVIYGLISFFEYLEITGVFKDSHLYTEIGAASPVYEAINIFLSGLIINFGFCGLRFLETNIRLQKELHASQLQTLNGQINPHSMFNILNHVHVLLQTDPEAADELLLHYAAILRYQLYNGNKEQVKIKQEIDFLKQYIEVEKVRWKNKVVITDLWQVENENLEIPPLLFSAFLENAFKYVARSDSEKGYVRISFLQSAKSIEFGVKNSKSQLKTRQKQGQGLGLPNIRARLAILYPRRHNLFIEDRNDCYAVRLQLTI